MTSIPPIYDRDGITIYNADCRDVLPDIDPASVGLLLTDPPYGIDLDTDYAARMHRSGPSRWAAPIANDAQPFDPGHLERYPRRLLFGANYFADRLPVGGWLVWRKIDIAPVLSDAELAWHNLGGKRVTYYESAISADRVRMHPTQKPVALMRWILERWTKPGELILDPYMGSGPIAAAAYQLGRRYVGIELVPEYCQAAINRLAQPVLFAAS